MKPFLHLLSKYNTHASRDVFLVAEFKNLLQFTRRQNWKIKFIESKLTFLNNINIASVKVSEDADYLITLINGKTHLNHI